LGFLLRLLLLVVFLSTESAGAGNRYFDGTMTFDDPAVADEAIVPMNHAGETVRAFGLSCCSSLTI
jgi:hypothetical protein